MRRHWKTALAVVIAGLAIGALDAEVGLSEDALFAVTLAVGSIIALIAFRPSAVKKPR